MTKRRLLIEIDCEDGECGECEYCNKGAALYGGSPGEVVCTAFHRILDAATLPKGPFFRCPECKAATVKMGDFDKPRLQSFDHEDGRVWRRWIGARGYHPLWSTDHVVENYETGLCACRIRLHGAAVDYLTVETCSALRDALAWLTRRGELIST